MRRIVLLFGLCLTRGVAADEQAVLTFDQVVERAFPDAERLLGEADLARAEREIASVGRRTREGPSLELEAGPRRLESDAVKLDLGARVEVPLLSGGRARDDADERWQETAPELAAALRVESRLRLRAAYLDAWCEQARVEILTGQVAAIERIAATVRTRVAEGADAPYEVALLESEALRSRVDSDAARTALGEAWAALRVLADLPAAPVPLAPPGPPDLTVPADARERFAAGTLRRAAGRRAALDAALAGLDSAQRRSRWSAVAAVGREGDESFATAGAAYRFPRHGEGAAIARERAAALALAGRDAEDAAARLATRFETTVERLERFGPIESSDAFDDALRAVGLRVELGKSRPSEVLPLTRQLLEARAGAIGRLRDAHRLVAELEALLAKETP